MNFREFNQQDFEPVQALADSTGKPQILSMSFPIPSVPAHWAWSGNTGQQFYFSKPEDEFTVYAGRALLEIRAQGSNRFERVDEWLHDVFARVHTFGARVPVYAAMAFTFDEDDCDGVMPSASAWIGRWQLLKIRELCFFSNHLLVEPGGDPAEFKELFDKAGDELDAASIKYASWPSNTRVILNPLCDYKEAVAEATNRIRKGVLEKVVLARTSMLQANTLWSINEILKRSEQMHPACCTLAIKRSEATFVAATPETLIRKDGDMLETEALAGTAKCGDDADAATQALLASEKDLDEHFIVADSIARILQSDGLSPSFLFEPDVKRFGDLLHLRTVIRAPIEKDTGLLDIASRLFPTPAVCGSPKKTAAELIGEMEHFQRGLYAGAMGWASSAGDFELRVGLRAALVKGSEATLYAGAGIVADSDPEREFAETEAKMASMRAILAGAESN